MRMFASSKPSNRLAFVDGARAIAAVYVVCNHSYNFTMDGKMANSILLNWAILGHSAVGAFIAISGFSLALGVARTGKALRLGQFAYRRARRILPTWYAALAFSLLIIWLFLGSPTNPIWNIALPVTGAALLSHLLLIHDWWPYMGGFLIDPPGWSIALEWQLYFLFPPLIWLIRRTWAAAAVPVAAVALFLVVGPISHEMNTAPTATLYQFWLEFRQLVDYFALFCLGVFAAWLALAPGRIWVWLRAVVPWGVLSLASLCLYVAVVVHLKGYPALSSPYDPLTDMLIVAAVLCAFVAASGHPDGIISRGLGCRPLSSVGEFSYSLYLVHYPILALIYIKLIAPVLIPAWHLSLVSVFALLIVGAVPICVGCAYVFSLAFERPFLIKH